MLDLFAIFSKSGLVLFAAVNGSIKGSLNAYLNRLIRNVILEDRIEKFNVDTLVLQFFLDNEFELVYVVGYQKMLSLSYVDKFLDDVQLAFRDKFRDFDLKGNFQHYKLTGGNQGGKKKKETYDDNLEPFQLNIIDFDADFVRIYSNNRAAQQQQAGGGKGHEMRTFEQSQKSKKTVASMIIQNKHIQNVDKEQPPPASNNKPEAVAVDKGSPLTSEEILKKLTKAGVAGSPKAKKPVKGAAGSAAAEAKKKQKKPTVWNYDNAGGKKAAGLDFSKKQDDGDGEGETSSSVVKNILDLNNVEDEKDMNLDLEYEDSDETEDEEDDYEQEAVTKPVQPSKPGLFGSLIGSLSYNKTLTKADLAPVLANLRDHLIAKNVAAEIATKLCDNVALRLEGQTANTWMGLKGFVKNALEESIFRILTPNRNLNILQEVEVKNRAGAPYVIVFCGVNGVGKSTNLAKIANWLLVNGQRVLVIACDTFRAGAIEQLRTHIQALKRIHGDDNRASGATKIDLFERGYGKDSTGIAAEGIRQASHAGYTVCLVDTAGRMQGNEPLMKQLAKLIKVNEPDLTLFVGEALVGNEAVDQLVNFNKALLDNGCRSAANDSVSAINGIVLTKFDTIDDQVGAAISMTYITGQPIVFVGVGQTYRDLKQLNAKAVVKALMR